MSTSASQNITINVKRENHIVAISPHNPSKYGNRATDSFIPNKTFKISHLTFLYNKKANKKPNKTKTNKQTNKNSGRRVEFLFVCLLLRGYNYVGQEDR